MPLTLIHQTPTDFYKVEWFGRTNFWSWERRIQFVLATLKVYVLTIDVPIKHDNKIVRELVEERNDYDDHILNIMLDALHNLYQHKEFAKGLWETLKPKYFLSRKL